MDTAGNLFIADTSNRRVRKVTPAGVISTVAGNGSQGVTGDGGPATSAEVALPVGVAVDPAGNLFVADLGNDRVRKVTPGGVISAVAGNGLVVSAGTVDPRFLPSLMGPERWRWMRRAICSSPTRVTNASER